MAGADREDLEQLERAVRGRLLEMQILKLSAQCRASESQFDAYLDVASTTAKPKVSLFILFTAWLADSVRAACLKDSVVVYPHAAQEHSGTSGAGFGFVWSTVKS